MFYSFEHLSSPQDFTGVPAVVDLACMRDAMNKLGSDSNKINPLVRIFLIICICAFVLYKFLITVTKEISKFNSTSGRGMYLELILTFVILHLKVCLGIWCWGVKSMSVEGTHLFEETSGGNLHLNKMRCKLF